MSQHLKNNVISILQKNIILLIPGELTAAISEDSVDEIKLERATVSPETQSSCDHAK